MKYEFTVECADHGEMRRDECFFSYYCSNPNCSRNIPDEEIIRLLSGAKSSGVVPIIVTLGE